jgi:uncharacterized protein (UPF0332 family)
MTPEFLEYFDRLSEGDCRLLEHLERHGHLSNLTLADLVEALVRARLALAQEHLDFAAALDPLIPDHRRQIISRAYYCMHHAGRALLLLEERQETTGHKQTIEKLARMFRRDPVGARQVDLLQVWHDWRLQTDYNPNLAGNLQAEAQVAPGLAQDFRDFIVAQLRARGATYV